MTPSNPRRATIADIAAEAGVSVAAVSYALNDKPGISADTRHRILEVAARRDWAPSERARSLSRSRVDVAGLVIPSDAARLRDESFWMLFISGLEASLRDQGLSLLLHVEPSRDAELEIYRSWHRRRMVDVVVVLDIVTDDPRLPFLDQLGLRYVLGGRADGEATVPTASAPDGDDMRRLIEALADGSVRRVARVAGDEAKTFVQERTRAYREAVARRGLADAGTVHCSFGAEGASRAALDLVDAPTGSPDVIVFDSDLLAVTGARAILAAGHRIPEDVQVVAFDDSSLCRYVTPTITALSRDAHEFGRLVGTLVLGYLGAGGRRDDEDGAAEPASLTTSPGRLIHRASTRPLT